MTSEYAGSMLLELVKDLEAKRCGKKFHFQVVDGTNIHLWLDKWHPKGILYLRYGHRLDMIQEGGGKISKCFEK